MFKKEGFSLFFGAVLAVGAVTLATVMTGCHVRESHAPRVAAEPGKSELFIRPFGREDISFEDTKFFMWRMAERSDDEVVAERAEVLKQVEELEHAQDDVFAKHVTRTELKARFEAVGVDVWNLPEQEAAAVEKRQELVELKAQLEEASKLPPGEETEAKLKKLRRSIDRAEKVVTEVDEQLKKITEAGLDSAYSDPSTGWKALVADLDAREAVMKVALNEVDAHVWLFNSSPIRFGFEFNEDRTIHAWIANWDLSKINDSEIAENDAPKEFSTDNDSIRRVRFEELGGVFTFEVYSPGAVYYFKIARAKYEAVDGRKHAKADVIRCSVKDGFGKPTLIYVRDFVQCGVSAEDFILGPNDKVGTPVLRRGAASLGDKEDKA
jgi:hypothetical protein